jgi:hypothetical protein
MVTLGQMDYLFCERVENYGRIHDQLFYYAAHGCFHPVTYFNEDELELDARNRRCIIKTRSDSNLAEYAHAVIRDTETRRPSCAQW